VYNTGTFVMLGGVIVGNIAWDRGGGVYNERGTFNREGGVVLGNIDLIGIGVCATAVVVGTLLFISNKIFRRVSKKNLNQYHPLKTATTC